MLRNISNKTYFSFKNVQGEIYSTFFLIQVFQVPYIFQVWFLKSKKKNYSLPVVIEITAYFGDPVE